MDLLNNIYIKQLKLPFSKDDCKILFQIDKSNSLYNWSLKAWQETTSETYKLWVVLCDKTWVGFLVYQQIDNDFHLLKIAIDEKNRRQKLASNLIKESLRNAGRKNEDWSIYLEVAKGNITAINFYKSLGFLEINRKKKFYSDGQDALCMRVKSIDFVW